jgi:PAS domain S-box-containing protein
MSVHDRYRDVFEAAPIGIIRVAPDGRFLMANHFFCQMLSYQPDELLSMTVFAVTYPDDIAETRTRFERTKMLSLANNRGDRSVDKITKRYLAKDGRQVWCEVAYIPEYGEHGKVKHNLAIVNDISEKKISEDRQLRLAAQLQQSQKMEAIGQLTGGMAHDFNNLLAIILGNLELLEERLDPGSREERLTRAALDAARRGAELNKYLLAFARRQPLTPRLIDLQQVLTEAGNLFRQTLGENIILELKLIDPLWPVSIDVAQLESALLNIAINARDAMPNGGVLTIEAHNATFRERTIEIQAESLSGDFLVLSVSDTGMGMSPEIVARACDPFFSTKGVERSGLGLSMVHGFFRQSGGQIRLYSEPGAGTTIRIYLPRAGDELAGEAGAATPASIATGWETILVVEDNEALRNVVVERLTSLGYRTMTAGSGAEALKIIEGGGPIDLLFTDIVMPGGMNGQDLAKAAKLVQPSLKLLFTSGFTAAPVVADEFRSNLLSKPYSKSDLARYIRGALDSPL